MNEHAGASTADVERAHRNAEGTHYEDQPASAARLGLIPATCTIQTFNTKSFLTAVGGGRRTSDVIHTDATVAQSWEKFTLVDAGDGVHVGIRTVRGNYLTAVGGGGRTTDVIHSDATQVQAWELFLLNFA